MGKKARIYFYLFTAGAIIYNIFLPLLPDEAYYWVWSRNLQLSYFDHPPLVAYFIKLMTLFGDQEVVIRLVAVISITLTVYIIYILARDMFGEKVAEKSLLIFLFLPLTQAGYIVVSPDSPLILFWVLTIFFFYKYIFKNDKKSIYLAGICGGLVMLSKYTGILLLMGLFLFLLLTKKRKVLLKKEVLISIILVLIIFSPVLIWNYNHDWVSFKFQFSHGISQEKQFNLDYAGEFTGGQLVAFNPVFFILLFYLLCRYYREIFNNKFLLLLFSPFLVTFFFFLYQGLFESSEVNWPAPAYITATIILAYYIDKLSLKRLYTAAMVVAVMLLIIVRFPFVIPGFPEEAVLLGRAYGFDKIFARSGAYITEGEVVLSDSYQNASLAQYYLPERPRTYIITSARISNYNYWSEGIKNNIETKKIKNAIYIGQKDAGDELKRFFENVKLETVLSYSGKFVDRKYFLYKCKSGVENERD